MKVCTAHVVEGIDEKLRKTLGRKVLVNRIYPNEGCCDLCSGIASYFVEEVR